MNDEYSPRRKLALLLFLCAVSWFALIGFVVSAAALWEALT